jgi:hypothetical protein
MARNNFYSGNILNQQVLKKDILSAYCIVILGNEQLGSSELLPETQFQAISILCISGWQEFVSYLKCFFVLLYLWSLFGN